jgi:hypothetical protein
MRYFFNVIYKQKYFLLIGIAEIMIIVLFIPSHPDDFAQYHALACGFPSQALNTYHAPCNSYFHQFGPIQYQQSYEYVGVSSSIIMGLLIKIMSPLIAHYAWQIVVLIIIIIGIYKSFEIKENLLLILFYFPLTYPILHNSGPNNISLIFFSWTPFLLNKAKKSNKLLKTFIYILTSLGWLVSTEEKPFFVYIMPGLFFLYLSTRDEAELKQLSLYWKTLLLFATLFLPTLFFLLVSQTQGKSYFEALSQNSLVSTHGYIRSILTAVLHFFSWFAFAVRSVDFNKSSNINQPEYFEAIPWGNGIISILSLCTIFITGFLFFNFYLRYFRSLFTKDICKLRISSQIQILSVSTLTILPVIGGAWTGHHYVFLHFVIIIILLRNLKKFSIKNPDKILSTLSLLTVVLVILTPPRSYNSIDSRKAIDYAYSIATDESVINCSYSCYFEYSLRNIRSIPVTFATAPSEGADLMTKTKNLISVCKLCQNEDVSYIFGSNTIVKHEIAFGDWNVFSVTPAPRKNIRNF